MAGPMARNVSDLTFAARGMYTIAQEKRDEGYMMRQRVLPIPWREAELPRKMKIGYFIEEGSVKVSPSSPVVPLSFKWEDRKGQGQGANEQTSPACRRAVQICVDKLREAGHEVELFEPPPRTSSLSGNADEQ
jgi:Asp-tRNA(Asn)/Glu-tRNA(Gln) amidotransferase A subunit family amidase